MLPFAFCPACYSAALTSDGFLFLDSLGGYKGGILGPLLIALSILNRDFHLLEGWLPHCLSLMERMEIKRSTLQLQHYLPSLSRLLPFQ